MSLELSLQECHKILKEIQKDLRKRPSYFSFNSNLGRCSSCDGTGYEEIELQFLSDISLECVICKGKKYNK